ncbi:Rho GTPase-activating protein 11A [Chamberlinius hualienensis]
MRFIDGISVPDTEAFRISVETRLKEFGFKLGREKCLKEPLKQITGPLFGQELSSLSQVLVHQGDLSLEVPYFLFKIFEFIKPHITCEGIFRKAGSVQRQKELKKCLESGGNLCGEVNDVACLVKQFLRGLPTPLIHPRLHDHLLKAHDGGNSVAILLLCASMRLIYLHSLRYVMTFFGQVANCSQLNKMNSHNLAVVLTPNIFSNCEMGDAKNAKDRGLRLQKETALIQWLIDNADQIGFAPKELFTETSGFTSFLATNNDISSINVKLKKKAKKRTSLNGVLSGFRKMVHNGRVLSNLPDVIVNLDEEETKLLTNTDVKMKVAAKRKSQDDIRDVVPKKSPRCYFESVHPVTPVPLMNENTISSIPNCDTPKNSSRLPLDARKRLSARMKFFGKGHLRRRDSFENTPKAPKVVAADKKSMVKSAHVTRFGRRFTEDRKCSQSSPSLPNVISSCKPSVEIPQPIEINLNPDNIDGEKVDDTKLTKRKSLERHFQSDDNIALLPARRVIVSRSASAGPKDTRNQRKVDVKRYGEAFMKPMEFNRSIRRGRPNTVNTGLPVESPFKAPKTDIRIEATVNITSFSPVIVLAYEVQDENDNKNVEEIEAAVKSTVTNKVQNIYDLRAESLTPNFDDEADKIVVQSSLTKVDSGVFDLNIEESKEVSIFSVDMVEEDKVLLAKSEVLSIDSGIGNSQSDVNEENPKPTALKLRRSSSLNSIQDSVQSFNYNNFVGDNLSHSSHFDVKWESAKTFVGRELKNEDANSSSSGLGRPSIIQLLKEKAGNVSSTAKLYDSICSSGSTPLKTSSTTHSCPRMNLRSADRKPYSPIKIPDVFGQLSPARASPCADRTNIKPDPVFKTPLAVPASRSMRANTLTPKNMKENTGTLR